MIGWGLACILASFAWWYLWRITFIQRDWKGLNLGRKIVWSYLVWGLVFLAVTVVLFYHQITDIWLVPPILKRYFPISPSAAAGLKV